MESDAPAPASALHLTAHDPVDLVACAVVALGFEPVESLVMLTFARGRRTFHARIDLPSCPHPDAVRELGGLLLYPAVRHRVDRVAFLHFSTDPELWLALVDPLTEAFEEAGIEVVLHARYADGRVIGPDVPDRPGGSRGSDAGVPADPWSHRFVAEAVHAGHVVRSGRSDLAALVAPDPHGIALVEHAWNAADDRPPLSGAALRDRVRELVERGTPLTAEVAVELLRAVRTPEARVDAWCAADRLQARRHLDLWASLTRWAPAEHLAGPATLAAISAAYAGDGAMAWCALDRAESGGLDDPWCAVIAEGLSTALLPETYAPLSRR